MSSVPAGVRAQQPAVAERHERRCRIAARSVHLRCDASLLDWLQPLMAAPVSASSPDLTVDLACAEPLATSSNVHVTSLRDGRVLRFDQPGSVLTLDRDRRALTGTVAVERLPRWERAKPLSLPLTVWASDLGLLALHAGFVARDGRGALLAGPSGSGKSTCAVACASAGFAFLADDYVLIDAAGDLVGHAIYAAATLDDAGFERIGLPARRSDAGGKVVVGQNTSALPLVASTAVPRVLLLPRIADAPRTTVRPATSVEALARLAPSSLLRRAVPVARNLAWLGSLTRVLPAYWLDLGPRLHDVPDSVATLLERHR